MLYKSNKQSNNSRIYLYYLICLLVFVFFVFELFKKTIIANKYYKKLSEINRTKEEIILAPRGIFFDRTGKPLVVNITDKKYGLKREYLYPEETAHLLGYMSLPNEINLKDYGCGAPPLSNQFLGKVGLEKYFECLLRGENGKKLYEVNASGEKLRELALIEAKQGNNINLSISLELQQTAHKAFNGQRGAAIATDPTTGEVLLFYSSPSYNTNMIGSNHTIFNNLSNHPDKPFFNRLASATYPPGSVIKPFFALGALEEGVVNSKTTFEDTGIFKLGNVEFGNWYFLQYGKKDGLVDTVKAISRSNDIFFYQIGVKMGQKKLLHWLKVFDFNNTDLAAYFPQAQGLLPTNDWKIKNLGEKWYTGDTVNLSIGQGFMQINPAQLHFAMATLANKGKKCPLTFVKNKLGHCQELGIDKNNIQVIEQGMIQACSDGGTAWPLFDFKINGKLGQLACKTGTAESGGNKALPHAWFTVYAPAENPRFALTIFVENGGEGSGVAAPIAKKILHSYFSSD
jgi:penicillin-binding protein 2